MNPEGLTLASSNWRGPQSYVGHNYAFRPYFRSAFQGRAGHYFAVGITTLRPGLFLSYPIEQGGSVRGVVALKLSLDPLEQDWAAQPQEKVAVVDANGVIISSSEPNWKFRTLQPLPPKSGGHWRGAGSSPTCNCPLWASGGSPGWRPTARSTASLPCPRTRLPPNCTPWTWAAATLPATPSCPIRTGPYVSPP